MFRKLLWWVPQQKLGSSQEETAEELVTPTEADRQEARGYQGALESALDGTPGMTPHALVLAELVNATAEQLGRKN